MSTLTAPEKGSWRPEESSSHSECALSAWASPPERQRKSEGSGWELVLCHMTEMNMKLESCISIINSGVIRAASSWCTFPTNNCRFEIKMTKHVAFRFHPTRSCRFLSSDWLYNSMSIRSFRHNPWHDWVYCLVCRLHLLVWRLYSLRHHVVI